MRTRTVPILGLDDCFGSSVCKGATGMAKLIGHQNGWAKPAAAINYHIKAIKTGGSKICHICGIHATMIQNGQAAAKPRPDRGEPGHHAAHYQRDRYGLGVSLNESSAAKSGQRKSLAEDAPAASPVRMAVFTEILGGFRFCECDRKGIAQTERVGAYSDRSSPPTFSEPASARQRSTSASSASGRSTATLH